MEPLIGRQALDSLGNALVTRGVDAATVGDVLADLSDLSYALMVVAAHYKRLADGEDAEELLDEIESQARDHMLGHVRSLRSTVSKIRRQLKVD